MTIIDVGGQDTKMIKVVDGQVADFLMNDKCAAGTGKFIEVMATRLGADLNEMYELAAKGKYEEPKKALEEFNARYQIENK